MASFPLQPLAQPNPPMAPRPPSLVPRITVPKKRASTTRRVRTNLEWRNDLMRIYKAIFESLEEDNTRLTLRKYCLSGENGFSSSEYTRIAAIWKELNFELLINENTDPSDLALLQSLDKRFPLETVNNIVEDDTADSGPSGVGRRIRNGKNVMRSALEWRALLTDMYLFLKSAKSSSHNNESVRSYCRKVLNAENQYRRISAVWKDLGLDNDLNNDAPVDDNFRGKIAKRYPAEEEGSTNNSQRHGRDLRPTSNSYFDANEEAVWCESVAGFARAGYPLEKTNLKAVMDAFLEADGIGDGQNSTGGISFDTVERIYKEGRLAAKSNVNPIDPKRAAQASPQVLNAFYHQLEATIKMAHEINPTAWPEDRYANIPPTRIYNADEQGPNPTALRNPVLIPADMLEGHARLFQNTREGDGKMQFHYSVANIVRADGVQCHPDQKVEGAPAPYIIISDTSSANELDKMPKADRDRLLANQSENDTIRLNPAVLEGWFDTFEVGKKDDLVNPFGFQVRTTPTGSMLKRTFFDFILHFVSQLPHDQGPNGLGSILFLDWHCSRECPQSLITSFFQHNVLLFILPSKTSIWGQPCDNGKNELTAKDIAFEAHNRGLMVGTALDYLDANKIFRGGLEQNCQQQNDELRRRGTNAVVSSFKKTGLYPIDYDNEGWKAAIQSFKRLNELLAQQKLESGELLTENVWVVTPIPIDEREELTVSDKEELDAFLPSADFLDCATERGQQFQMPHLFLAASIGEQMIGEYVLDRNRDVNQPPQATEEFERAALKLITFVLVTPESRVDTRCTLSDDAIAHHKLRTKLCVQRFGHSVLLRRKEDGAEICLTKQSATKFVALEGQRRESRNFTQMTLQQVLDNCVDNGDDDAYTLTKKDKRKGQKKKRVERKKLNEVMYGLAEEIGDERRLKRNLDAITDRLAKRPRFALKLATLLEEEDMGIDDLYGIFEDVVLEPFSDIISVTHGDTTKEIKVTRVGTDITAVSQQVQETLMRVVLQLKAKAGEKRKRRRKAGQSTHLGKSGLVAGILIQRQNKEEELKVLQKEEKGLLDDLERMKGLHTDAIALVEAAKDDFWKWDVVKGWKRKTLARLMGVYKSSAKADAVAQELKQLNLTAESVKEKIEQLKRSIDEKTTAVAPLVAEQREREDFLSETARFDTQQDNGNDRNASDGEEDSDRDEDDEDD
ncbi:unknown protein [Seminavis robusta]|uniref:Uncharacterized protein n=1 Tax=Seminavis robusta TaxID=568900 RepID=A0A9N8DTE2_9STRA|nr:unknown protein [Seminavis robusta]|eukprot:Sro237_g095260.1 n/a (1190) ;mRNA; f:34508-38077